MKKFIIGMSLSVACMTFVYAGGLPSVKQVATAVATNTSVKLLANNPTYGGGKAYVTFLTKGLRYTVWSNPDKSIFSVWVRKNGTHDSDSVQTFAFSGATYFDSDMNHIQEPYPKECEYASFVKVVSGVREGFYYKKGITDSSILDMIKAETFCNKHLANIANYYSL